MLESGYFMTGQGDPTGSGLGATDTIPSDFQIPTTGPLPVVSKQEMGPVLYREPWTGAVSPEEIQAKMMEEHKKAVAFDEKRQAAVDKMQPWIMRGSLVAVGVLVVIFMPKVFGLQGRRRRR